ncbi:MAG TPA: DNA mismatch repair endonuclease MutL [Candidatus Micrarchaeia archaeon]|nr:DNA mismatch repair endonuclease MutL [Candidatus Micrarchaeia archaeon]
MTDRGSAAAGPGSRIHLLPAAIADAIAAGEVVERPASVVKELVENALDAGARQVRVEIEEGGRERIAVVDDGGGMTPEELRMAFGRHATSKVRSLEDLTRIETLGFRGEALASIGAVATVEAVSRRRGQLAAARVVVQGATVEGPLAAAGPPGTRLIVTELFATTPARRAFLRPGRTEALRCARVVADCALASPGVAFELHAAGRRVLRSPGSGELLDAVRAVFGAAAARGCWPLADPGEGFGVVGVVGGPEVARGNRAGLVIFVNGRRVQQRSLEVAVESAYRGLLGVGRHPLAVLDLRCDPAQVDVNVHPTKREVRFRDDRRAFQALERACWLALRGGAGASVLANPLAPDLAFSPQRPAVGGAPSWGPAPGAAPAPASPAPAWQAPARPAPEWPEPAAAEEGAGPGRGGLLLEAAAGWRLVGQVHHRYLLAETGDGIAVLDQHAVHERILYARLLDRLESEVAAESTSGEAKGPGAPSQGWLIPELLEIPAGLVAGFAAVAPWLGRLGFALQVFGETTLRCTASPPGVRAGDAAQLVAELVEAALDERPDGGAMRRHRLAALVACHTAVRFGDPLAPAGAERLLRDLASTPAPETCPHGRPTVLLLGDAALRRAFHRPPPLTGRPGGPAR